MYSFPNLEPVCCSMSSSNCCFLNCVQISQEAGKVHIIFLKGQKECHTINRSQFYPFLITLPKVLPSMIYFHHSTLKSKGRSPEGHEKSHRRTSWDTASLFLCAYVLSHVNCATPQATAYKTPLSTWFSRQECWSGAISFSRGSSRPRDQTHVSCTGRQVLYHWATWEAPLSPDLRTYKSHHWS